MDPKIACKSFDSQDGSDISELLFYVSPPPSPPALTDENLIGGATARARHKHSSLNSSSDMDVLRQASILLEHDTPPPLSRSFRGPSESPFRPCMNQDTTKAKTVASIQREASRRIPDDDPVYPALRHRRNPRRNYQSPNIKKTPSTMRSPIGSPRARSSKESAFESHCQQRRAFRRSTIKLSDGAELPLIGAQETWAAIQNCEPLAKAECYECTTLMHGHIRSSSLICPQCRSLCLIQQQEMMNSSPEIQSVRTGGVHEHSMWKSPEKNQSSFSRPSESPNCGLHFVGLGVADLAADTK